MVRKTQSGKSPSKKSRKNDNDNADVMFTTYSSASVHKRNLCIVSFPIIFLFNILRSLLYQFFILLRFIYCRSSTYLVRHQHLDCDNNADELTSCSIGEVSEMAQHTARNTGPGPGDPLLAKQKHHHRRAFEFISRALKIDEENEGALLNNFLKAK